jgi:hypothetical protein
VKKLDVSLALPDSLAAELETAAAISKCSAPRWVYELVEATLAARRLPHVSCAPGQGRSLEYALDHRPVFAECRTAGPLHAVEIPTVGDLECLNDIT